MKKPLTALLLALCCASAFAGEGVDDGIDAYRAKDFAKALRILQPLADKGHGQAAFMLSMMYANGQGVAVNGERSTEYALKAADANNPQAMFIVASMYFTGRNGKPDAVKGMEWLEKGAKEKDTNSMRILAQRLALGHDVAANPERAFRLMQDCADGHHDALCTVELGKMYEYGIGTERKPVQAKLKFQAIQQGSGESELHLGSLILHDKSRPDPERAMEFFAAAAKRGNAEALNQMGLMYLEGRGVPADPAKAASWFEQGADRHNGNALFNGGKLFFAGSGVKQDKAEAANWFKEASDAGHPGAMRELARLYETGQVLAADKIKAKGLYCNAALLEQRRSMHSLDESDYLRTPQEVEARLATLMMCSQGGANYVQAAAQLAGHVKPEQLSRAEALAARLRTSTGIGAELEAALKP